MIIISIVLYIYFAQNNVFIKLSDVLVQQSSKKKFSKVYQFAVGQHGGLCLSPSYSERRPDGIRR